VFEDREDFERYVKICKRYKDRYGFKLYHWVLMNNHVHLVMETKEEGPLCKIMQGINLSYTLWFNRKNRKVGHLWQDRFKSALVEKDSYLLECGRYVERNPVRAGLVEDPKSYPWNSYRVHAYGKDDGITDMHGLYKSFGTKPHERQRTYRDYVLSHRDSEEQELRAKLGRGVLGSEDFGAMIQRQTIAAQRPKRGRPRK
jgi:putative transposase